MIDRLWLWLAKLALRRMSNAAAWEWYCHLSAGYKTRPDLRGEVPARYAGILRDGVID